MYTIIPTGKDVRAMDVRAVDDLLPQPQSRTLMLMRNASNQTVHDLARFCMDKKSDAKRRRDDDILSAVLYEQKELHFRGGRSRRAARANGEGADDANERMQVLLRTTNWSLES